METLNLNQQVTLNDMRKAPRFVESIPEGETLKWNGLVFGSWNKNTVKSLERKGYVTIQTTRDNGVCVEIQ